MLKLLDYRKTPNDATALIFTYAIAAGILRKSLNIFSNLSLFAL